MSETETDWSSRTGPVATAQLTRDDEGASKAAPRYSATGKRAARMAGVGR